MKSTAEQLQNSEPFTDPSLMQGESNKRTQFQVTGFFLLKIMVVRFSSLILQLPPNPEIY